MNRIGKIGVLCLFALVIWGCQNNRTSSETGAAALDLPPLPPEAVGEEGQALFTEVSEASGIDFTHSFGDSDFSNLVEAVGSGAAFFDYDRDGWLDIYITTGKFTEGLSQGEDRSEGLVNRLFRNRGNGTFEDRTAQAGVAAEKLFSMGVSVGDFDNDGFPDIYLCNYGHSILFHNNGDGTFTDITARAGVANEGLCSAAAAWLDFDRDGLLDLYVTSYIDFDPDYTHYYSPDGFPGPMAYSAHPDRLYRNLGDGRFEDISRQSGLAALEGRGMSVSTIDFDLDGYPDLYVTNDATENFLLHNEKGQRFSQIALDAGVGYNGMGDSTASMGVDFGDYDLDGRLDLFVSDNSLSSLYRNEGEGLFMDVVVESGIALSSAQFVGWGSFFFDYDNDGDLDILKVNSDLSRLFGQEDQLFQNDGKGKYQDVSPRSGDYFQRELLGRGAAFGDYDNDGDLDVLIVNIAGKAVLLRNDGGNRGNWLRLDLRGKSGNRDSYGSVVRLYCGSREMVAYKKNSTGYLSQSDPRLHFGLGDQEKVDRIEVTWPSGERQILENVDVNQTLTLEEPSASS